jgi:hypothetical protein
LPLTPVLVQELQTFRVRIDQATAHDSYSAWHERDHSDLVLATALACWWSIRVLGDRLPDIDMSRGLQGLTQPPLSHPSRHRQAIPRHIMRSAERRWGLEGEGSYSAQGEAWEEEKRAQYLADCARADEATKQAAAQRRAEGGFQGAG